MCVKIDSGVTFTGSRWRNPRNAMLLSVSHGIPCGSCGRGAGRLSSSYDQWCDGVTNATLVSKTFKPNLGVVDSQLLSVIRRAVGLPHGIFAVSFGMASADVDRRQLEIGYSVLRLQLWDQPDLAYGLDLFDQIDLCRRHRDEAFEKGLVPLFSFFEALRNKHIDSLSKLLEKAALSRVHH